MLSVVTLFMACCFCMDCKLCSLGLEMDQNRSLMSHVVVINTLCSVSTFTTGSVNLRGWGGDGDRCCGNGVRTGTEAVGMGTVFIGTGSNGVQFLSPCRPLE